MATSLVDRAGFGVPLEGGGTVDGSAVLSTTPVKVTLPDVSLNGGLNGFIKVKIVNPNAANILAWKTVGRGATAPTFGATFAAAAGSHILPGQVEYLTLPNGVDLYLVASAAASSWSATSFLFR
jgi:hypothetical protein